FTKTCQVLGRVLVVVVPHDVETVGDRTTTDWPCCLIKSSHKRCILLKPLVHRSFTAEAAIEDSRWKRATLSPSSMTPAERKLKLRPLSGSTHSKDDPAP